MHRRGGHRAAGTACSGLVGGQQNGSSMGSRLSKTEVVVTALCWKGGAHPPTFRRSASTPRSHTRPQKPPLTDRPGYYTPHHHFPDHETRKTQTKHSVCPVGPALWMAAIKILRSLGPCRLLPSHLCNQHRFSDDEGRMLDARWRRRVGDDSHAATWRGCRWLLTLSLSFRSSLRCARAKPGEGRFIQGPQRCAVITSGRELS